MLSARTRSRHFGIMDVVLALGIASSWELQMDARWWEVELVRGEQNAKFVRLAVTMVARRGGAKA